MDQSKVGLHKEAMISCPRCSSTNTKFCYYNNYSLSQPRYFCKSCRRYWTEGGSLRNIPVGGGSRKRKSSTTTTTTNNNDNNNWVNSSNTQDQKRNPRRNGEDHCFKAIEELIRVPNYETGSDVEMKIANATPEAASLGFGVGGGDGGSGNSNHGGLQRVVVMEKKLPLPVVHQQNEDATGNLWSGVYMGGESYW